MVVHLTEELERLVRERLDSGHYGSPDEVISEALFALEERDKLIDVRAAAFKDAIQERLSSGPATVMDFASVKRSIREQVASRAMEPRR